MADAEAGAAPGAAPAAAPDDARPGETRAQASARLRREKREAARKKREKKMREAEYHGKEEEPATVAEEKRATGAWADDALQISVADVALDVSGARDVDVRDQRAVIKVIQPRLRRAAEGQRLATRSEQEAPHREDGAQEGGNSQRPAGRERRNFSHSLRGDACSEEKRKALPDAAVY